MAQQVNLLAYFALTSNPSSGKQTWLWDGSSWSRIDALNGAGVGGSIVSPGEYRILHGYQNSRIFLSTGGAGGYVSTNGGQTWAFQNVGTTLSAGCYVVSNDEMYLTDRQTSAGLWKYDTGSWSKIKSGNGMHTVTTNSSGNILVSGAQSTWFYDGSWLQQNPFGALTGVFGSWLGDNNTGWVGGPWSGSFEIREMVSGTIGAGYHAGTDDVISVWGFANNDVWTVGDTNTSSGSIRHWNGSGWSLNHSTAQSLYCIHGLAADEMYAGGRTNKIYRYNGSAWSSFTVPTGLTAVGAGASDASYSCAAIYAFYDVYPPSISEEAPTGSDVDVNTDLTFKITDQDYGINTDSIDITVNSTPLVVDGVAQAGYAVTYTADGSLAYDVSLTPDNNWNPATNYSVTVYGEDTDAESATSSWTFSTSSETSPPYSRHQFEIPVTDIVSFDIRPVHQKNEYDEHASLVSLPRLRSETNWEYKRRTMDTLVHVANSSYQGLVHGITRELGLSLSNTIDINPKVDGNLNFLAPDPYILFSDETLYLYSDYQNSLLDWSIDISEGGGNYEHLYRLVDFINTTYFFEAAVKSGIDNYTRSVTILNQSNRKQIDMEFIPLSTKFNLRNRYLSPGTVYFSNRTTFKTEVATSDLVTSKGKYHIDYSTGVITVYTIPNPKEHVRYHYTKYPFYTISSPIILHDINSADFKKKMFEQVLQDDGTYTDGLPTELGVDIINELMSVTPMYWGI